MTAAGPLSHTPQSQFAARGGAGRLAFGRPALPWLGFSVSEFKLAPGEARWRTCSGPPGVARGGMQVAWRGRSHLAPPAHPSGPGGARAPALHVWRGGRGRWLGGGRSPWRHPSASHGHRRRLESTPGAFCTVLPMATGGVSRLLQVLFALFCPCPQAA